MPRFDPPMHMQHYVPSAFGTVENHRHYLGDLGAAASAASLTIAQRKEIFKRNRQLVRDQLRRKKLLDKIDVNADGSLLLKTPARDIDRTVSRALRTDLLAKITTFNAADKQRLASAPFSFVMSALDPAIDFFGEVCNEIMQRTGKRVYDLSDFPGVGAIGRRVDLTLVQPDDAMFDATSQRQLKSIRTILALFVLYIKQWPEWQVCLLARGVEAIQNIFGGEEQVELINIDRGSDGSTAQTPLICTRLPNIPKVSNNARAPYLSQPLAQGDQFRSPTTSEYNRNRVMWVITLESGGKSFIKLTWTALYDFRFRAAVAGFKAAGMSQSAAEALARNQLGDRMSAVAADRLENKPAVAPPVGGLAGLGSLGSPDPFSLLLSADVLGLILAMPTVIQILLVLGAFLISLGAVVVIPLVLICFQHEEAMQKEQNRHAEATQPPPAPAPEPAAPPPPPPPPPPAAGARAAGGGVGGGESSMSPLLIAGALGLAVFALSKR